MKTTQFAVQLALALSLACSSVSLTHAASERISPEFLAVLRSGNTNALRAALCSGNSPNGRDASGTTPLMHAAIYGDAGTMRLLLANGAEVNATNSAGATALMRSAFDSRKVALLLEHGADVHARSRLGNTALILAARPRDSLAAVAMLLGRRADPNTANLFGATALMAAAAGGDSRTVELLIEHGANPNAQPGADPESFLLGGGRSPLMWAAFRGNQEIGAALLAAGARVNEAGFLGTPLAQAAWTDQIAVAKLLIERGADPNLRGPFDGYAAVHWAASTDQSDATLLQWLLDHGANPDLPGGAQVDAFMGTPQTPLMLARRRGETPLVNALIRAGASKATPGRPAPEVQPAGEVSGHVESAAIRAAISRAIPPLQTTSIDSKGAFLRHASRQDCVSCHQQMLPMAAIGLARKQRIPVDRDAEQALLAMIREGDIKDLETDWQPLFHPEPVHAKGYSLLALAAEDASADSASDAWVHHLSVIQGKDGQWHNNLPRPPIQTDDIGATALAIHALQRYPLPGRQAEFATRVDHARRWLWSVHPGHTEGRAYQILGLAWAGESAEKIAPLVNTLILEQRPDGGWAQLPILKSDAYATGQALYALRIAGRLDRSHAAVDRGLRFLLVNQLSDGTWHVRRRAFPFQPTMHSGFPHGRDSWISAAGSSWAVMALSVSENGEAIALNR